MISILLADEQPLGGTFQGFGLYGFGITGGAKESFGALAVFNTLISNVIGVMTVIAGLWFIFNFIIGAYGYLSASGEEGVKKASSKISYSLIGLVIVIAAFAIIAIIGEILGFRILHPELIIPDLAPK